jgi:hypothetical protein
MSDRALVLPKHVARQFSLVFRILALPVLHILEGILAFFQKSKRSVLIYIQSCRVLELTLDLDCSYRQLQTAYELLCQLVLLGSQEKLRHEFRLGRLALPEASYNSCGQFCRMQSQCFHSTLNAQVFNGVFFENILQQGGGRCL